MIINILEFGFFVRSTGLGLKKVKLFVCLVFCWKRSLVNRGRKSGGKWNRFLNPGKLCCLKCKYKNYSIYKINYAAFIINKYMFIQFSNLLLVILLRNQIELALVQAKILIFISII